MIFTHKKVYLKRNLHGPNTSLFDYSLNITAEYLNKVLYVDVVHVDGKPMFLQRTTYVFQGKTFWLVSTKEA